MFHKHLRRVIQRQANRLARSVPDARSIADELAARGVTLALGQSWYDPAEPMGKMFFNILATFAEFEADLIRLRTREGMKIARAKGKLRGKQPKAVGQATEGIGSHACIWQIFDQRPGGAVFDIPADRLPNPSASSWMTAKSLRFRARMPAYYR
jgi:hypothetical protein